MLPTSTPLTCSWHEVESWKRGFCLFLFGLLFLNGFLLGFYLFLIVCFVGFCDCVYCFF